MYIRNCCVLVNQTSREPTDRQTCFHSDKPTRQLPPHRLPVHIQPSLSIPRLFGPFLVSTFERGRSSFVPLAEVAATTLLWSTGGHGIYLFYSFREGLLSSRGGGSSRPYPYFPCIQREGEAALCCPPGFPCIEQGHDPLLPPDVTCIKQRGERGSLPPPVISVLYCNCLAVGGGDGVRYSRPLSGEPKLNSWT